jgi:hypothetical protein
VRVCSPVPLNPAQLMGLGFPTPVQIGCDLINSPTGDLNFMLLNECFQGDLTTSVYRYDYQTTSVPCLATYRLTADNAFRIYLNNTSANTNNLPGAEGVCGNQYAGNDWTAVFAGAANFPAGGAAGAQTVHVETVNGTQPGDGNHPLWLSGKMLLWEFAHLNSSLSTNFNHNNNLLVVNYPFSPQTNGALFNIRIEYTNSFPNNQNWITDYQFTGTNKQFKFQPSSRAIPMICDENGGAVRIVFTAMAGACQTTSTYLWACNGFKGGGTTEITHNSDDSKVIDFILTEEQIAQLHEEHETKLVLRENMSMQLDSIEKSAADYHDLMIFPNPSKGQIMVQFSRGNEDAALFQIINQLGVVVFEGSIQGRELINLDFLPNGIYKLKAVGDLSPSIKSKQFILQR